MGNIVILVGSMRKGGNTDLLAQAFAEGARENHSVEIVSVADYKVKRGVKDKGDIEGNVALKEAYDLGLSIK